MKKLLYYQQTTKNNLENIRNSLRTENPYVLKCWNILFYHIISMNKLLFCQQTKNNNLENICNSLEVLRQLKTPKVLTDVAQLSHLIIMLLLSAGIVSNMDVSQDLVVSQPCQWFLFIEIVQNSPNTSIFGNTWHPNLIENFISIVRKNKIYADNFIIFVVQKRERERRIFGKLQFAALTKL